MRKDRTELLSKRRVGVPVSHPEFFWFGTRRDASWFADPADGRYNGAVELRWDQMVEPLARITDALRAGDWTTHPDGDSVVDVKISGLTLDEESAILDLVSGRPIQLDPWDTELTDGRHRTWGFWTYDPAIILPFQSRLLWDDWWVDDPTYTRPEDVAEFRAGYREEAAAELPRLPSAVTLRSTRYVDGLTRLAAARDLDTPT